MFRLAIPPKVPVGAGSCSSPTTSSACSSAPARSPPLALVSGSHHERLDGTGYHRGAAAAQLTVGARLLADAADVMT